MKKINNYKINWSAVVALIVYPAILIAALVYYTGLYGIKGTEVVFILLGHYVTNISVGVGLHRLWAHNAFKANKFVEFILTLLSAGALQGPVLAWASDHYKHHTFTDEENDPHSPKRFKNPILGFLWSHIGWMLVKETENKQLDMITIKKLGRNKLLVWQLKYYWQIAAFMLIVPPMILGYIFNGQTFVAALSGILFIGIGRAFQQHMTFCVNSACHFWGSKKYANSTAGDIWWLGLLLLGENWHNFHHAFPSDYRNGIKWYHTDVHKWIIYALHKLGLAWDLNITPKVRVEAKVKDVVQSVLDDTKSNWVLLYERCENLKSSIETKVSDLHSKHIKESINSRIIEMQKMINMIIDNAKSFAEHPQKSSKKIFTKFYKQVEALENAFKDLMVMNSKISYGE